MMILVRFLNHSIPILEFQICIKKICCTFSYGRKYRKIPTIVLNIQKIHLGWPSKFNIDNSNYSLNIF